MKDHALSGKKQKAEQKKPYYDVKLIRDLATCHLRDTGRVTIVSSQEATVTVRSKEELLEIMPRILWYPPLYRIHWVPMEGMSELFPLGKPRIITVYPSLREATDEWLMREQRELFETEGQSAGKAAAIVRSLTDTVRNLFLPKKGETKSGQE